MPATSLTAALGTVAASAFVGAFLDFWMGRQGQDRVKKWLEDWWLRLSYVRWGNFGREEALYAIRAMDALIGPQFFSTKRVGASIAAGIISLFIISINGRLTLLKIDPSQIPSLSMKVLYAFVIFSLSVSLTINITKFVTDRIPDGATLNIVLFFWY